MLDDKLNDEPDGGHHATGDLASPGSMSHAEIFEKSREFWDATKDAGHPGFEGVPVPPPTRLPAAEYSAPPSNLPGPQSVAALKSRADKHEEGGNNGLRPNTLPPPAL